MLKRTDSAVLGPEIACANVAGATSGLKRSLGDLFAGYVLCLGPR